jgi:hypothetical protein
LAKPNYNFAKRQRELAKKAKKDEKQQRKAAAANPGEATEGEASDTVAPAETPGGEKPAA